MSVVQKDVMDSFIDKVGLQVRTNRMMHGDRERPEIEWAAIAATHMGHLMEAVLKGDRCFIEKELLHTVAPLLELYRVTMGARCSYTTQAVSNLGTSSIRNRNLFDGTPCALKGARTV